MKKITGIIIVLLVMGISFSSNAQLKLKDKLRKAENSVDQRTDQGMEKGLDKAQEKIGNLFKKKDKSGQTQENGQGQEQQQQPPDQQEQQPQDQNGQAGIPLDNKPSLESYSKFDFIPGEKVIFYEDFSQDAVGDFPALWNTNGSGEVVNTNLFPGNWLEFKPKAYSAIWTDAPLNLPENYTVEFDIIPTKTPESGPNMQGYQIRLYQCENVKAYDGGGLPGKAGFYHEVTYYGTSSYSTYVHPHIFGREAEGLGLNGSNDEEKIKQKPFQKYHISIWVQKSRLRLYQDETKVFDIPKALPLPAIKYDRIRFEYGAGLVSNIRVAVGAPDTRNKLMTEGKLVTYGIYFDVNKDVVKPESYGTLKEIAKILNEVPDVKVKIIGHTDADGADAANLDLSKRRAASVKAELVKTFSVNGDRLETDGLGETQPVASNDTPVNKALNRRVELIKM